MLVVLRHRKRYYHIESLVDMVMSWSCVQVVGIGFELVPLVFASVDVRMIDYVVSVDDHGAVYTGEVLWPEHIEVHSAEVAACMADDAAAVVPVDFDTLVLKGSMVDSLVDADSAMGTLHVYPLALEILDIAIAVVETVE